MNKTFRFAAIALFLSVLAGCSRSASSSAPPPPPASGTTVEAAPVAANKAPLAAGRSLIVTMTVGFTVDDVDRASASIRDEVARAGGYVADASAFGTGEGRNANLVLRVPSDKVRELRAKLGGVGELTSDTEKVDDVTEERADLEARLHNARVQEKRIVELMSSRAGTIGEVIESEKELARVRETIERLEAQQRSMTGKIDLATIHVSLATRSIPAWHTPGKSIARAGSAGLTGAAAFGTYLAMALTASAPILVPLGGIITALVLLFRGRRRQALAG